MDGKNTTYKVTGKVTIIPIAEKDRATGAQRWFRDENGVTHAEGFQASMLDASDPKKRRYLRWRVTAQEAEALANQPLGTTFSGEFAQSYVADENGAMKADIFESAVNGADYCHVECLDIDIAKEGKIKFAPIRFMADVPRLQKKKEEEDGDNGAAEE